MKLSFDKEDSRFEFNYQNSGNGIHDDLDHRGFIRICCGWPLVRRLVARRGLGCSNGISVSVYQWWVRVLTDVEGLGSAESN